MLSRIFGLVKGEAPKANAPPVKQLEDAASTGDLPGVQAAIRGGCSIDERLAGGMTPLMAAAMNGKTEVCRWLLEQGADVTARSDDGSNCLHWGSMNGTPDVLTLLLGAGANPGSTDEKGWLPPFMCLLQDNFEALTYWLEQSFDLNCRTSDGRTMVYVAATLGADSCLVELVTRGADLEAKDSQGQTPLLSALSHAQRAMARYLVERGANIRATDGRDATGLHHAAWGGLLGACRSFLQAGLDVDAKDADGFTPLHTAAKRGYPGIEQLLVDYGALVSARTLDGTSIADLRKESAGLRQVTEEHALFAQLPNEITVVDAWSYVALSQEISGDGDDSRVVNLRRKLIALLEDLVHQYKRDPGRAAGKVTVSLSEVTREAKLLHPPEDPHW